AFLLFDNLFEPLFELLVLVTQLGGLCLARFEAPFDTRAPRDLFPPPHISDEDPRGSGEQYGNDSGHPAHGAAWSLASARRNRQSYLVKGSTSVRKNAEASSRSRCRRGSANRPDHLRLVAAWRCRSAASPRSRRSRAAPHETLRLGSETGAGSWCSARMPAP